jgi:ABC-type Fe3+ transport system substrate-binding protein
MPCIWLLACRTFDYACELGEFARLLDDPFEGIEIENGRLTLPEGPGSGAASSRQGAAIEGGGIVITRREAAFGSAAFALTAPRLPHPRASIAMYKGPDRADRILAGAKTEGKVAFYSGMIENQALRPLADAFKKKYPFVAVEYWRGDSRALVQKALTERRAGRVMGDILESTGGAEALIRAGATEPFYSPSAAGFPANYIDPKGMWIAFAARLFRHGLQHAPGERGRRTQNLRGPARSEMEGGDRLAGRFRSRCAAVHRGHHARDGQRERAKRISSGCRPSALSIMPASARALVDRVGEGEYKLALEIYAHHPLISKAKGAPLDTQMLDPVHSALSTIQLAKNAPHPNAAMLFIDFALSKEGQEVFRAAQYLSPNPQVDVDPSLRKIIPRFNNMKETVFTPELMFQTRDDAGALFNKYFR